MEFEELATMIADVMNIPKEKIRRESTFEELGADSLDIFQIMIGVEESLGIQVDPSQAEKLRTVEDVLAMTRRMACRHGMPGGEN